MGSETGGAGVGAAMDPPARIEGGTSDKGKVEGISFPASCHCIRCIATANPSLVSRPLLLKSARSLFIN